MARYKDITNQKFGRLTAIEYAGSKKYKNASVALWKCRCDCGVTVIVDGQTLRAGKTKSCGCLSKEVHREVCSKRNTMYAKHGGYGTRLYRIWNGMKDRCYNPNCHNYQNYGGRGIAVCEEWENDFSAFRDWAMNHGYNDTLSIDRICGNKNYEPSNCRWATAKEQCNNLRTNVNITYRGETKTAMQWSEETGIPYGRIVGRFHRGLPVEQILRKE